MSDYIEKIQSADNDTLLDAYAWHVKHFNPINETQCEHYQQLRNELKMRLDYACYAHMIAKKRKNK